MNGVWVAQLSHSGNYPDQLNDQMQRAEGSGLRAQGGFELLVGVTIWGAGERGSGVTQLSHSGNYPDQLNDQMQRAQGSGWF